MIHTPPSPASPATHSDIDTDGTASTRTTATGSHPAATGVGQDTIQHLPASAMPVTGVPVSSGMASITAAFSQMGRGLTRPLRDTARALYRGLPAVPRRLTRSSVRGAQTPAVTAPLLFQRWVIDDRDEPQEVWGALEDGGQFAVHDSRPGAEQVRLSAQQHFQSAEDARASLHQVQAPPAGTTPAALPRQPVQVAFAQCWKQLDDASDTGTLDLDANARFLGAVAGAIETLWRAQGHACTAAHIDAAMPAMLAACLDELARHLNEEEWSIEMVNLKEAPHTFALQLQQAWDTFAPVADSLNIVQSKMWQLCVLPCMVEALQAHGISASPLLAMLYELEGPYLQPMAQAWAQMIKDTAHPLSVPMILEWARLSLNLSHRDATNCFSRGNVEFILTVNVDCSEAGIKALRQTFGTWRKEYGIKASATAIPKVTDGMGNKQYRIRRLFTEPAVLQDVMADLVTAYQDAMVAARMLPPAERIAAGRRAAVLLSRQHMQLHPFGDANTRIHTILLLNFALHQQGDAPAMPNNPNRLAGCTQDVAFADVQSGQLWVASKLSLDRVFTMRQPERGHDVFHLYADRFEPSACAATVTLGKVSLNPENKLALLTWLTARPGEIVDTYSIKGRELDEAELAQFDYFGKRIEVAVARDLQAMLDGEAPRSAGKTYARKLKAEDVQWHETALIGSRGLFASSDADDDEPYLGLYAGEAMFKPKERRKFEADPSFGISAMEAYGVTVEGRSDRQHHAIVPNRGGNSLMRANTALIPNAAKYDNARINTLFYEVQATLTGNDNKELVQTFVMLLGRRYRAHDQILVEYGPYYALDNLRKVPAPVPDTTSDTDSQDHRSDAMSIDEPVVASTESGHTETENEFGPEVARHSVSADTDRDIDTVMHDRTPSATPSPSASPHARDTTSARMTSPAPLPASTSETRERDDIAIDPVSDDDVESDPESGMEPEGEVDADVRTESEADIAADIHSESDGDIGMAIADDDDIADVEMTSAMDIVAPEAVLTSAAQQAAQPETRQGHDDMELDADARADSRILHVPTAQAFSESIKACTENASDRVMVAYGVPPCILTANEIADLHFENGAVFLNGEILEIGDAHRDLLTAHLNTRGESVGKLFPQATSTYCKRLLKTQLNFMGQDNLAWRSGLRAHARAACLAALLAEDMTMEDVLALRRKHVTETDIMRMGVHPKTAHLIRLARDAGTGNDETFLVDYSWCRHGITEQRKSIARENHERFVQLHVAMFAQTPTVSITAPVLELDTPASIVSRLERVFPEDTPLSVQSRCMTLFRGAPYWFNNQTILSLTLVTEEDGMAESRKLFRTIAPRKTGDASAHAMKREVEILPEYRVLYERHLANREEVTGGDGKLFLSTKNVSGQLGKNPAYSKMTTDCMQALRNSPHNPFWYLGPKDPAIAISDAIMHALDGEIKSNRLQLLQLTELRWSHLDDGTGVVHALSAQTRNLLLALRSSQLENDDAYVVPSSILRRQHEDSPPFIDKAKFGIAIRYYIECHVRQMALLAGSTPISQDGSGKTGDSEKDTRRKKLSQPLQEQRQPSLDTSTGQVASLPAMGSDAVGDGGLILDFPDEAVFRDAIQQHVKDPLNQAMVSYGVPPRMLSGSNILRLDFNDGEVTLDNKVIEIGAVHTRQLNAYLQVRGNKPGKLFIRSTSSCASQLKQLLKTPGMQSVQLGGMAMHSFVRAACLTALMAKGMTLPEALDLRRRDVTASHLADMNLHPNTRRLVELVRDADGGRNAEDFLLDYSGIQNDQRTQHISHAKEALLRFKAAHAGHGQGAPDIPVLELDAAGSVIQALKEIYPGESAKSVQGRCMAVFRGPPYWFKNVTIISLTVETMGEGGQRVHKLYRPLAQTGDNDAPTRREVVILPEYQALFAALLTHRFIDLPDDGPLFLNASKSGQMGKHQISVTFSALKNTSRNPFWYIGEAEPYLGLGAACLHALKRDCENRKIDTSTLAMLRWTDVDSNARLESGLVLASATRALLASYRGLEVGGTEYVLPPSVRRYSLKAKSQRLDTKAFEKMVQAYEDTYSQHAKQVSPDADAPPSLSASTWYHAADPVIGDDDGPPFHHKAFRDNNCAEAATETWMHGHVQFNEGEFHAALVELGVIARDYPTGMGYSMREIAFILKHRYGQPIRYMSCSLWTAQSVQDRLCNAVNEISNADPQYAAQYASLRQAIAAQFSADGAMPALRILRGVIRQQVDQLFAKGLVTLSGAEVDRVEKIEAVYKAALEAWEVGMQHQQRLLQSLDHDARDGCVLQIRRDRGVEGEDAIDALGHYYNFRRASNSSQHLVDSLRSTTIPLTPQGHINDELSQPGNGIQGFELILPDDPADPVLQMWQAGQADPANQILLDCGAIHRVYHPDGSPTVITADMAVQPLVLVPPQASGKLRQASKPILSLPSAGETLAALKKIFPGDTKPLAIQKRCMMLFGGPGYWLDSPSTATLALRLVQDPNGTGIVKKLFCQMPQNVMDKRYQCWEREVTILPEHLNLIEAHLKNRADVIGTQEGPLFFSVIGKGPFAKNHSMATAIKNAKSVMELSEHNPFAYTNGKSPLRILTVSFLHALVSECERGKIDIATLGDLVWDDVHSDSMHAEGVDVIFTAETRQLLAEYRGVFSPARDAPVVPEDLFPGSAWTPAELTALIEKETGRQPTA